MHALRLSALLASMLLACARPAPDTRPPDDRPAPTVRRAPRSTEPSLHVRLTPRADPIPELAVELVARDLAARDWTVATLAGLELLDLTARDARGDLPLERAADGPGARITLARAPVGELHLSYKIRPDFAPFTGDLPTPLRLRIDRDHALVSGEQLLLPTTSDPVALHLELAEHRPGLSTSLGVDPPPRVRPGELRGAALLLGTVGRAVFRGLEGADDFAWAGETRFDLRWSSAETAGARTAVDAYFGAEPGETARFTGLFAVDLDVDAGAQVVPRSGGLYIALAPDAEWNASIRLAIAQGLVHRWIGGRLRLRASADEPREAGLWFSQGVARHVAREVLYDLGTLSADDYVDELNRHHAELATSPLRHAGNAEVAAAAVDGDPDAATLLMARGVLYATLLDAAAGRPVQTILRELVDRARQDNIAELPLAAFTDLLVAEHPDEPARFHAIIVRGVPPRFPTDALGPCFVRTARTYTRFDLGFDLAASSSHGRIRRLRRDGPAARAGIREGEPLLGVTALSDDPDQPVEVALEREGHVVQVSYRPRGASGRGDAWKRDPRASERECPR